jgi:uncharacterized protein (DUF1501 family)
MHRCTRRSFMKAGALALVAMGMVPRFIVRTALAQARTAQSKVLVVIFQRGAVDGLSMLVPHGDPEYYAARARIAIARPSSSDGALDLDGFFGLHPALSLLEPIWGERRLAAVHACGSPDTTRSHFDAQDNMESGTPGVKSTPDGWLARGLAATPEATPSPFRAVALGPSLPRVLRGEAGAVAMSSLADFDVREAAALTGALTASKGFESLYEQGVRDLLYGTGRETFDAVRMLKAAAPQRLQPAHGATYPRGRFGDSLRQIAQLIRADVGLEVAFADINGWDTHAAQGGARGQLALRLGEFGAGLAAFDRDLGDRMRDVVVLTMSEFGRTVRENGNRGTDHGHGTAMFVIGGGVRGGQVHGRWPGLSREQLHDGRDLAVTTDFRSLFAEVAVRHLGVPVDPLFPAFTPQPLELLPRNGV